MIVVNLIKLMIFWSNKNLLNTNIQIEEELFLVPCVYKKQKELIQ